MSDVDLTRGTGRTVDPAQPLEPGKSLGELVSQMTHDFSELVSTQIELAKVEITHEVTKARKGAGMLTGGALAAYLAILLLSFAAAWGLDAVMPTGWAFVAVAVAWGVVAAVMLTSGKKRLSAVQPVPPHTKASLKEDVEWARQQKS